MQKKDFLLHINFMPRCAHNWWTYRLAQTNSSEVISFEDYHLTVADSKQTCLIGLDSFSPTAEPWDDYKNL